MNLRCRRQGLPLLLLILIVELLASQPATAASLRLQDDQSNIYLGTNADVILSRSAPQTLALGNTLTPGHLQVLGDLFVGSGTSAINIVDQIHQLQSQIVALQQQVQSCLTQANAATTYLTQTSASATYATQTSVTSQIAPIQQALQANATQLQQLQASIPNLYLSRSDASTTYLSLSDAAANYTTQASARSFQSNVNRTLDNVRTSLVGVSHRVFTAHDDTVTSWPGDDSVKCLSSTIRNFVPESNGRLTLSGGLFITYAPYHPADIATYSAVLVNGVLHQGTNVKPTIADVNLALFLKEVDVIANTTYTMQVCSYCAPGAPMDVYGKFMFGDFIAS